MIPWLGGRRSLRRPALGNSNVDDARRLADAERALELVPPGCAWLDERTVTDLDLPLVFGTIDRTATPIGAQALWRWLVAPARDLEIVADRERRLARFTDPGQRAHVHDALDRGASLDATLLPTLLWPDPATPARPLRARTFVAIVAGIVALLVLSQWWPVLAIVAFLAFGANILIDDWMNLRLAHKARALEVLGRTLGLADDVLDRAALPEDLRAQLATELAPLAKLRKRIGVLAVNDPLEILSIVRAGLLIRLITLASCLDLLDRHRERLRRIVLWIGELDATCSVATLRAERDDLRVPTLLAGDGDRAAATLHGRDLAHPAIADAIGNDVDLVDGNLLVTGSNMSGKSTFLRTVAVNAILAQSIHTTVGCWRATPLRVHAAMRIIDATAEGVSTYAAEVAALRELVAAVRRDDTALPALFVVDEPFSGTNPTIRVPIVVSVLEYLGARDVVIAATHDLDVAAQLGSRFGRAYFCELDGETFDRKLRPGVAPSHNAVALLARAGYPDDILRAIAERL